MSYKFRIGAASTEDYRNRNKDFPYMGILKKYNIQYKPEDEEVVENRQYMTARTDYIIEIEHMEDLTELAKTIGDIIITKDGRLIIYDDYIE